MEKRVCAVCGCECPSHLKWRRESDGHIFTVCIPCTEAESVNAESVNNYEAGHIANSFAEIVNAPRRVGKYNAGHTRRGA